VLRSFRLANHRSFRDEHELLLMPAYDKTGRSAVPVAAVYGANAAGKSNLLDGLRFMAEAVRHSYAQWKPAGGVPRRPFRLDPGTAQEPSMFVVELVLDSVRHVYGFVVDDEQVLEEWLYTYPHGRRRVIVERTGDKISLGSTVEDHRGRGGVLRELTRPNALFLSLAAQVGQTELMPAYRWFAEYVHFSGWGKERLSDIVFEVMDFLSATSHRQDELRRQRKLVEFMRAADLGLGDVQVRDPRSGDGGLTLAKPELVFVHGPQQSELAVWEESAGTVAWLRLVLRVLTALDAGGTVVVDEIDASLHPELAAKLVLMFQDDRTNPRGDAQLLFATHDATLLGTAFGEEVLARDQIWFVEKDTDGASRLYPLSDFHPRRGENRERRYLGGSYGAVPMLSDSEFAAALRSADEEIGGRAS